MEYTFRQFVNCLADHGYDFATLDHTPPDFSISRAYLRYDVRPSNIAAGLQLAELHAELRVPGTFHLAWDQIEANSAGKKLARRFREFDSTYVRLGLQCDPISRYFARACFGGDHRGMNEFVGSPEFVTYLRDLVRDRGRESGESAAWRRALNNLVHSSAFGMLRGGVARSRNSKFRQRAELDEIRRGAWQFFVVLERSFRRTFGACASVSGRGSVLSAAFLDACDLVPELHELAPWFSPIDFLADLGPRLGHPFEATRFEPDQGPGPTVLFGGADGAVLRQQFAARVGARRGFVAIFPVSYWEQDRYADLLPMAPPQKVGVSATALQRWLPDRPVLTNIADLTPFGPRCELVSAGELAAAARPKVGARIDLHFPSFVDCLRSEGYGFGGFEEGPPLFSKRWAYLRYDVHVQDLLAAYVLADLHAALGIVGSFQITWDHTRVEREVRPYFAKLMEFDRRYIHFGLHAAPTATWFVEEMHGGEPAAAMAAVNTPDFTEWLLDLRRAQLRAGAEAPELRRIREGTDAVLSQLAESFRATFGRWKSISGHGSFLNVGFDRACQLHPDLKALEAYFTPVAYMREFGVARFGFDLELTTFDAEGLPLYPLLFEGMDADRRREQFRTWVERGLGFVALFHPATWTGRQNTEFFLPDAGQC